MAATLAAQPIHLNGSAKPVRRDPSGVLNRLLQNNAQWAADVARVEPGFFDQCAKGQAPKVLWIGCADSRVPESVIMACKPGEVFVTRNIANQVHLHDDSIQSVLTYAIAELGVEHVVVVGHSHCGGVAACLGAAAAPPAAPSAPLGRWLAPLTDLARALHGPQPLELVEANVRAQVQQLLQTDAVRAAWGADRGKTQLVGVHGWVYDIEKGRLRDLAVSAYDEV
ncbi:carbonic anhydrase [Phanerochaete sordida]|uniref:Carbonic anhydrase n=1 Tax=Phanerochaete sordida TaxID=48140 RepID=A0A9P3GNN4_9APHY|nr:carbonic anhydrase [Phanerochaete sordida]